MANTRNLRLELDTTYIPLTLGFCVGGNANFRFGVGGNANFRIFRYQHVGIPNTNSGVGGLDQRNAPSQKCYVAVESILN